MCWSSVTLFDYLHLLLRLRRRPPPPVARRRRRPSPAAAAAPARLLADSDPMTGVTTYFFQSVLFLIHGRVPFTSQ